MDKTTRTLEWNRMRHSRRANAMWRFQNSFWLWVKTFLYILAAAACLAWPISIVYVVLHFILKYW